MQMHAWKQRLGLRFGTRRRECLSPIGASGCSTIHFPGGIVLAGLIGSAHATLLLYRRVRYGTLTTIFPICSFDSM